MIVSKPIRVLVEIEDLETGCSYIYEGATKEDCINYFQAMFFTKRKYKFLQYQTK